ncbi:(d)CMP kinase [Yeguia hominis]|uniref:Cytidylate kinase n=1 Tax=Yeguia hominis TaxID=2763662 RepID=A0A926HT05_9FIRM|nr:(d)CMP kinase [Yeguia hominis]MBC8534380.1 (d)CMP kinase [Yeguia hominis]
MIAVAIDGPAGAGKSSVARSAAKKLGYLYADTGALYRAVGLYMQEHGVNFTCPEDIAAVAQQGEITVELAFQPDGQHVFLCGDDVTGKIRTPEVSMAASRVSAVPAVRKLLFQLQRDMALKNNVLMDGRDIGTVVLPDAQVKVFLTASPEERARRRCAELQEKGTPAEYETVLQEIRQRDEQDMNREIAPLKAAPDAVLLDTSELSFDEVVDRLVAIIREKTA